MKFKYYFNNKIYFLGVLMAVMLILLNTPPLLAATTIGSNISTDGNLVVNGALRFTSGAVNNYILTTDGSGNATWIAVGTALGNSDTDALPEGASNLYFTNARADARITAQKGLPGGLATLDGAGKVPASQLPAITISDVFVVADIAARNALTVETGDVAIVLDAGGGPGDSRTYIYDGAAWQELLDPTNLYLRISNNLSDLSNPATARTNLGLGNVENTALSTWGGSVNITTVGTITGGVWNATPISPTKGGTGLTTYNSGDILYASAADTLAALPKGNNGDILTLVAGLPAWQAPAAVSNAISTLTAALNANSINNNDWAQTWNWNLTTANNTGLTLGENVASTATGNPAILKVSTLATSTAMPLWITNLGDGPSFRVDDENADTSPFFISKDGNVGIGASTFDAVSPEKLKVDAGVTTSYNVISGYGDVNNYLQLNIRNRNSGSNASSDIVATADNGTENQYYIDMGINSSGYSNPSYSITGPNDGYLYMQGGAGAGGNLAIGTATPGTEIKFHIGGTTSANEVLRINSNGNLGLGTTSPNARLDIGPSTADALRIEPYGAAAGNTGNLEFMELAANGSNYVGFKAPDNIAANTVWTLPNADGSAGQVLTTDGAGGLVWTSGATNYWQRVGTIISPVTAGDDVTTSGNIYTSGTGAITSAGLLTANAGATISGGAVSINDNSNFNTNINTGTSTGLVTIGNPSAGAIQITSGTGITLNGAASSLTSTGADIEFQPSGAGTTALVKIGAGGAGSTTPDLLALDVKSTAGDPAGGTNGAMYYNANTNKFRCYINGSWNDCDTTGGTVTLQSAYNNGATITTAGSTPIAFTLTSGDFNVSGAGSVNLTPTGASQFTSGGALTLTAGAASTWGTSAGDLTFQVAGAGTTASVKIGAGGAGSSTPDLLALDVKSTAGDPAGYNGAMYYNASTNTFRCYEAGGWKDCGNTGTSTGTLQQAYNAGATITTAGSVPIAFTLTSGDFNVSGAGSVNLTPTGASQFTSGGALTLTAGAASTWSTSSGALTVDSAAGLNLGTTNATGVTIGKAAITTTNLGPLQLGNASTAGSLKIADGSSNYITLTSPAIASDYTLTLPVDDGTSGQALITDGSGNLSWASLLTDPMTTRGDLIYRDATNTTARLGRGTAGQVLKSDGTDISWASLTSSDVGLGNVTNDAQIPKAIGLAKGDLIAYTASNTPVRLPQSGIANGAFLIVDSSQATGLKWIVLSDYLTAYSADKYDFSELKDALTLDDHTSIAMDSKNLTINDTGSGVLTLSPGGALTLTGGVASTWSTSSGALTITSAAAATWGTSAGNLSLQAAGTGTTANIQVGAGGAGSTTPDLLVLDVKTTAGDPTGTNGAMYYNANTNKLRCYENGAWKDCDTTGTTSLQTAYNTGATITTAGSTPIAFTLTSGDFNVSGAGSVNLTPTGASQFTSSGALTLTAGAASTWSTTAGNLILQAGSGTISLGTSSNLTANDGLTITSGAGSALTLTSNAAATWGTSAGNLSLQAAGTGATANIQVGAGGAGSTTPDLLVLDVKSTAGDPTGTNGAMYYNANTNKLRCYENGAWKDCDTTGAGTNYWQRSGTNLSPATAGDDILLNSGETLTIGGGTTITKHLSATGSIDFPSIAQSTCSESTITVTGAVPGDTAIATPTPVAGGIETLIVTWSAYVSANNTVTVRACAIANNQNPANQTWRVDVWQH